MTHEERMRMGLLVLAANLRGDVFDFRPIRNDFAQKMADFALALANNQPFPEFDDSLAEQGGK